MGVDAEGVKEDNLHSFNRYAYGHNNPFRYIDPDGNLPIFIPIAVTIIAEGLILGFEAHDNIANPCGDCVRPSGFGLPGPPAAKLPGVVAERIAAKEAVKETAITTHRINEKIYKQLEKQLERVGANSIRRALQSAEKTLQAHKDKLPSLEFKSQVEGTIRNVEQQVDTLKQFIKDKNL